MLIRDRIKELRRVRARDLLANPKNWRVHPKAQTAALRGLLGEVGLGTRTRCWRGNCPRQATTHRWTPAGGNDTIGDGSGPDIGSL
jgi:hypothetical protein